MLSGRISVTEYSFLTWSPVLLSGDWVVIENCEPRLIAENVDELEIFNAGVTGGSIFGDAFVSSMTPAKILFTFNKRMC